MLPSVKALCLLLFLRLAAQVFIEIFSKERLPFLVQVVLVHYDYADIGTCQVPIATRLKYSTAGKIENPLDKRRRSGSGSACRKPHQRFPPKLKTNHNFRNI